MTNIDDPPPAVLRLALWAGVAYFCCMAAAHFFGLKYPLLFVYYDVPFHAYQDKIVSFAVVAYACLFADAALHRTAVPAALTALGVTVLGLAAVNRRPPGSSSARPPAWGSRSGRPRGP